MFSNAMATNLDELRQDFDEQASSNARWRPKLRKKIGTKDEILRRKETLYEKCLKEIDGLLDAYYEIMNRKDAESIGALYARYSSRFQDSIAYQVRTIFEEAVRKKVFIPRENVFFDIAIRGWKDRRPGLLALREKIEAGQIQTLTQSF